MKKRVSLLFLVMWMVTPHLYAQNESVDRYARFKLLQKRYTITIQPMQLLLNNGLRLDFETRIGEGPNWLQFGPTLYMAKKNNVNPDYYYYDNDYHSGFGFTGFREPFFKLKGGGLDINYKRFIDPRLSAYLAAGLSYTHFNLNYYGVRSSWKEYTQDGLLYHEYNYMFGWQNQHINRMSINCYFGHQVPSSFKFLFDMFVGISYRHSFSDKEKYPFNKYKFSYGYTGFVWMTGIRLGIGIK